MPTLSCSNFFRFQENFLIFFMDPCKFSVRIELRYFQSDPIAAKHPQVPIERENVSDKKNTIFIMDLPNEKKRVYISWALQKATWLVSRSETQLDLPSGTVKAVLLGISWELQTETLLALR